MTGGTRQELADTYIRDRKTCTRGGEIPKPRCRQQQVRVQSLGFCRMPSDTDRSEAEHLQSRSKHPQAFQKWWYAQRRAIQLSQPWSIT